MANVHKPLLLALLDTDWTDRFESFSVQDTKTLVLFNDLMWDTTGWDFFQQPVKFHVHRSADRAEQQLEHAGLAELRAAADDFRQLWMKGEPGCYHAVNKVLARRLKPRRSSKALFQGAATAYKAASREILMWTGVPPGQLAVKGIATPIRAHQVVDDWMHGIKAHRDPEKRAHVEMWSPDTYEFTLIKAMHGYLDAMLLTHVIVRGALGVLGEDRRASATRGSRWGAHDADSRRNGPTLQYDGGSASPAKKLTS